MTAYTFKPSADNSNVSWDSPSSWVGGAVPNSPDADVDFPVTTRLSDGSVYKSAIYTGQNLTEHSVELRDLLFLNNSLTVDSITLDTTNSAVQLGSIGAALTARTITNNDGVITGFGFVSADTLYNHGSLGGYGGQNIDVNTFVNTGLIFAAGGGSTTIHVGAGGFAGLANGIFSAGTLLTQGANLIIHAGSAITVDAATIRLSGGEIISTDPTTGQDVGLVDSLKRVATNSNLTIDTDGYHFRDVTLDGVLSLSPDAPYADISVAFDRLRIGSAGSIQGVGTVVGPIENDGMIKTGVDPDEYRGTLVIDGPVTGSGSFEIRAGHTSNPLSRYDPSFGTTLELGGATAQAVTFDDANGSLILDKPSTFSGTVTTSGSGDHISLRGVTLSSITNVSYIGNRIGGTLTLQRADGPLTFHFAGSHALGDFSLVSAGQVLSSDPGYAVITITGNSSVTSHAGDFDGNRYSDILWHNLNGAVSAWSGQYEYSPNKPGTSIKQDTYDAHVATSWHVVDTFDYDGDGKADILWHNDDGSVSIWTGTSNGFRQAAYNHSPVDTSWRIAGAGDFNGDGKGDILWQNNDRSLSVWASTSSGYHEASYTHGPVAEGWNVSGVGDFDGDGKADILWRNANGDVSVWNANANGFDEGSFYFPSVATSWHIAGVGDFNGDGRADIVWHNDDGAITVWEGNGKGFDQVKLDASAGKDWSIAQVGDFDADGKSDLLWRNTSGAISVWTSAGDHWNQNTYYDASVGNDWSVSAHHYL